MDHLGLTKAQLDDYHALLMSDHDFEIRIDVEDTEENHVASPRRFIDGQVNLNRVEDIKRTATATVYDPDGAFGFDSGTPFGPAIFANRFIRVRHIVHLPGVGDVEATPIVGPAIRVDRKGDEVTVEIQDKTAMAVRGTRPYTAKKGKNAVDAIHDIMWTCTGERRFRFPKGVKRRLPKSYSVGWKDEASPWAVCQKIADLLDMELFYAGDGHLVLRHRPHHHALVVDALTAEPTATYDVTEVKNVVRVSGEHDKKKHIDIAAVALPGKHHPMHPDNLGRHDVPWHLPLLIDDSSIRRQSRAKSRAEKALDKHLPMSVQTTITCVPFFHLDHGDVLAVRSSFGDGRVRVEEGSIPLGTGGDMVIGEQRQVSRPRRR